jgi:hypothetical protein
LLLLEKISSFIPNILQYWNFTFRFCPEAWPGLAVNAARAVEATLDTAPAPAENAAAPDPASPLTLLAATKPVAAPALNDLFYF